MLVLTRKEGERIRIGDDVEVVVVKNRHGRVSLGIQAPRHVSIRRQEVFDRDSQWDDSCGAVSMPRQQLAIG